MRQPVWQRAASYAARLHDGEQRDDGKTPYFSHPARVAMTVRHLFGCDDDHALAAAFLHDVMENTDKGYDSLRRRFGSDVATLVVALTKNMMLPKKERERDYEERLARADWRARLIKLADQFDNVTDTLTGLKKGYNEELLKAKRIMKLAKDDALEHAETARAIAALKELIKADRAK